MVSLCRNKNRSYADVACNAKHQAVNGRQLGAKTKYCDIGWKLTSLLYTAGLQVYHST
jgi:hypothetical protein